MSPQANDGPIAALEVRDREWMKDLDQVLSQDPPTDEQIQVLLLLRARREQRWTATGVSLELQMSLSNSEEVLEHLADKGFLYLTGGNPPAFTYVHLSDKVDAQVQCLALAHEHHRRLRSTSCSSVSPQEPESLLQRFIGLFNPHRP